MAGGRLAEAMAAMDGELVDGDPRALWSGAAIDSRRVRRGELFFALRGERTDGHLFVGEALERGAAAAVVQTPIDGAPGPLIRVEKTFSALHALTREVRRRVPRQLVAITGSVGKTTTKELLAAMLAERFACAKSPGNLNNLCGFPLALLAVPEGTEWMVAEMGMSTPGELSELSRLGRPDVAVFTTVRAVHLEFFPDLRGIAEAKAELLEGLEEDGIVVANLDDAEVRRIAGRHRGRVVYFGLDPAADHRASDIASRTEGGTTFEWWQHGRSRTVELALLGKHNVSNFLAAAACASTLGVPEEAIREVAARAVSAPGRGQIHRIDDLVLIDDSYNSSPAALEAALESLVGLEGRRHWAVLGDMLELGSQSAGLHRAAGRSAARHGLTQILGVGSAARDLVAAAAEAGSEGLWCESAEEAAALAERLVEAGDVLLVKGSHAIGLELVVEKLLAGRSET